MQAQKAVLTCFCRYSLHIKQTFAFVYTTSKVHRQLSTFPWICDPLSTNIITIASQKRLSHLLMVACLSLHQNITFDQPSFDLSLLDLACSDYLIFFVTQCCYSILGGRGRTISILIREAWKRRAHNLVKWEEIKLRNEKKIVYHCSCCHLVLDHRRHHYLRALRNTRVSMG